MLEVVEKLEDKLKLLDESLVDPANLSDRAKLIELNQERRRLEAMLEVGRKYREIMQGIADVQEIISGDEDAELVALAREELEQYESQVDDAEQKFKMILLPRDPDDDKSAVVEMRAGTGGDEAGIFVGNIFHPVCAEVLQLPQAGDVLHTLVVEFTHTNGKCPQRRDIFKIQ